MPDEAEARLRAGEALAARGALLRAGLRGQSVTSQSRSVGVVDALNLGGSEEMTRALTENLSYVLQAVRR